MSNSRVGEYDKYIFKGTLSLWMKVYININVDTEAAILRLSMKVSVVYSPSLFLSFSLETVNGFRQIILCTIWENIWFLWCEVYVLGSTTFQINILLFGNFKTVSDYCFEPRISVRFLEMQSGFIMLHRL